MKRVLIACVLLTGCATSEYYSPQVEWNERTTISSCNVKQEIYRKDVAEGVVLEIYPPSTVFFRISTGKKVQLLSDYLIFFRLGDNTGRPVQINKIITGEFPEPYQKIFNIPEISYLPTKELIGLGRYKNIDLAWGEWSSYKGRDDIFMLKNDQFPLGEHESFSIKIPSFIAGEQFFDIPKIAFYWKKGRSLGCAQ